MNTEQERAELLTCPFCGGEAFMEEHPPHKHSYWLVKTGMPEYSAGSFTIECVACECGMIHESRDGVVAAWNRRAALQSQDRGRGDDEWLEEHIRLAVEVAYGAPCNVCSDDWHGENKAHSVSLARLIDHARRIEGDGE